MRLVRVFIVLLICALLAPSVPAAAMLPTASEPGFAAPSFGALWARTDRPVAQGTVARSWVWGPGPGPARTEPYKEAPGGLRTVQGDDQSRRVFVRQWPQQDGIDNGKNCRRRTDAQGERQNRQHGKAGLVHEHTDPIAQVADEGNHAWL